MRDIMRKRRREKSARLPFGKLRKPLRHMRCEETTSQLVTSPVQKQLRSTPADQLSLAQSGLFARRYCLSNPIPGTKEEDRVVVYRNFNLTELMKQLELRQVAEVELLRQMTLSISCNLTSVVTATNTAKKMEVYFKQKKRWSYSVPTTIDAAFGPFQDFPQVGRDTQLHQIWMEIILSNKLVVNKQEALYFHGSPGLGKTYLVRRIFSKTDFPCGYGRAVEAIKFLALDFNRSACNDACRFKEDLKNNPNLFALARLFYVNFAVQKKLKWDVFLEEAVVPLIRYGLAIKFVELMELQFKI